ncbi:MAG: hypothetical protein M3O34_20705 [Chloroflexota bacterium]|nr:hypothetical protein [Chloroflexota bacterium]
MMRGPDVPAAPSFGVAAPDWERLSKGISRQGTVDIPEAFNLPHDRVRWGPILAGVAIAITAIFLLAVLGAALGLAPLGRGAPVDPGPAGADARTGLLWAGGSVVVAFLIGGMVAGATAAVFDRGWGALNGALVFLTALPLLLSLAAAGIGGLLGLVGQYAAAVGLDPNQLALDAGVTGAVQPGLSPDRTAWSILAGLLFALGASTLGGAIATRRRLKADQVLT